MRNNLVFEFKKGIIKLQQKKNQGDKSGSKS